MKNKKFFLIWMAILVLSLIMSCDNGTGASGNETGPFATWNLSFDMRRAKLAFLDSDDSEDIEDGIGGLAYGMGKFVVGGSSLCEDENCQYKEIEEIEEIEGVDYSHFHPTSWYSTDGAKTWKKGGRVFDNTEANGVPRRDLNRNSYVTSLGFGGGTFIAGIGPDNHRKGYLSTSTDGINWKEVNAVKENKAGGFGAGNIVFGNETFVYDCDRAGKRLKVSKDYGQNWIYDIYLDGEIVTLSYNHEVNFDNGLFYTMMGSYGILSSPDGINWSTVMERGDENDVFLESLLSGSLFCIDGVFIVTGANNYEGGSESYIVYSKDNGQTWKPAYCDPELNNFEVGLRSAYIHKIAYGGGYLVAVGSSWVNGSIAGGEGRIWYSDNLGKSWKTVDRLFPDSLYDVVYGDGTFVVSDENGKFYYSNVK